MALYQPQYGTAGYKPALPGNQMTAGRVLDSGRMPTAGIGALQQITNPNLPGQAIAEPFNMSPAQAAALKAQPREMVSSTREAQQLAAARQITPGLTLAQFRSMSAAPATPQPQLAQLRSAFTPFPAQSQLPAQSVSGNPYGVNPIGNYVPPQNPATTRHSGAPAYQPQGIVAQFQNYMMSPAARPALQPQPQSMVYSTPQYPKGVPATGPASMPYNLQAQQLAAQAARNK